MSMLHLHSVDAAWLESVRQKNRASLGMAGMHGVGRGGMGYVSSSGIVRGAHEERELRTQSIHAGRFTKTDPNKPTEGSVESVAQALGPVDVPPPAQLPKSAPVIMGVLVLGLGAFILYKVTR